MKALPTPAGSGPEQLCARIRELEFETRDLEMQRRLVADLRGELNAWIGFGRLVLLATAVVAAMD
jgi:hypothetical protein